MPSYRTELAPTRLSRAIDIGESILLVGSCFTEHIGSWLQEHFLPATVNPWGVLFNPASIAQSLERASGTTDYAPEFIEHKGVFCSLDHHGQFNGTSSADVTATILKAESLAREALQKAQHIFVTWGTAWVFEHKGKVVANCHKLPATWFQRRRLSVEEIVEMWERLLHNDACREKHFIFTVSPIRHLADGLHGNQLSKSTLLLAIDELQRKFPQQVDYLPAYELLMDDLRDYRFYAEDMVHPSPIAIQAVREMVRSAVFTPKLQAFMEEADQVVRDLNHRPSNPESEEYKAFLAKALKKKEELLNIGKINGTERIP